MKVYFSFGHRRNIRGCLVSVTFQFGRVRETLVSHPLHSVCFGHVEKREFAHRGHLYFFRVCLRIFPPISFKFIMTWRRRWWISCLVECRSLPFQDKFKQVRVEGVVVAFSVRVFSSVCCSSFFRCLLTYPVTSKQKQCCTSLNGSRIMRFGVETWGNNKFLEFWTPTFLKFWNINFFGNFSRYWITNVGKQSFAKFAKTKNNNDVTLRGA